MELCGTSGSGSSFTPVSDESATATGVAISSLGPSTTSSSDAEEESTDGAAAPLCSGTIVTLAAVFFAAGESLATPDLTPPALTASERAALGA